MKKSIAALLNDLKLLDKRIKSATQDATFCGVKIGSSFPTGFNSAEEFNRTALASVDSLKALIANRMTAKSAIVVSNATTTVEVGGVKMTVAEAIERKSSIEYQKETLKAAKSAYAKATMQVDRGNLEVKQRLDQQLLASRGKDGKADVEGDAAFSKGFLANNEYTLLDPLKMREFIISMEEEIDVFEANVDLALSTSNAITEVEI
jgi:hypothetical protein